MSDTRYKIHNELVNRILILLHSNNLGRFWSNPTGAVKTSNGHFQRYGLVGSSDIIGISNSGKFVGIEIKTGATSVQSKHQKSFQKMIEKQGGHYFLIRSEDQISMLKEVLSG
ncbi:MAG: hypothetical protein RIQ94_160 [Pseudomonadota bacterium]|jgi:hypothetical protein